MDDSDSEPMQYEPAPPGSVRPFLGEYGFSVACNLDLERIVENSAHSLKHEILRPSSQTHLLLNGRIPLDHIIPILEQVDLESRKPEYYPAEDGQEQRDMLRHYLPYLSFKVNQLRRMESKSFYELFFKLLAEKIMSAEVFHDNERAIDFAKWITNNFDRFAYFENKPTNLGADDYMEEYWREQDRKKQTFLGDTGVRFGLNAGNVVNYINNIGGIFGQVARIHPTLHFGVDAPIFDEKQTDALIGRFYNAIKGYTKKNFSKGLDGAENHEKHMDIKKNIDVHLVDPKPDEIKRLAVIADTLYHAEFSFMFQGATRAVSIALPRWVITLQEAFIGNYSGSSHPLLNRGLSPTAYKEEGRYVHYILC